MNKKKNLIAKSLKDPRFKQKVVKPKKGKGSFNRKKLK
ncbi:alternative ribosome rescue factor ArfA [Candidatus Pelagibacter sp.]|nr:alternative ribosome rescue factor ArfA [Candidatus Pelagibacter sp.]